MRACLDSQVLEPLPLRFGVTPAEDNLEIMQCKFGRPWGPCLKSCSRCVSLMTHQRVVCKFFNQLLISNERTAQSCYLRRQFTDLWLCETFQIQIPVNSSSTISLSPPCHHYHHHHRQMPLATLHGACQQDINNSPSAKQSSAKNF